VEVLNPDRGAAHHPLFQVMFALQNTPPADFDLPGLAVRGQTAALGTSRFDLFFSLTERPERGGIDGFVEYATDLFDRSTVDTMVARWLRLLDAVLADPRRRISTAELLTGAERAALLPRPRPTLDRTVPEVFAAQDPAALALDGEERLTYGELDARSDRLASWLIGRGVRPESRVAVVLPRSVDYVVAVLAVLKAGGVYVPVDPGYPVERRE
ncbi:AMP-binding protein, partial [Vibrio vulnificus]|nr:AMP-binding protein [Vibrio vulnificus]